MRFRVTLKDPFGTVSGEGEIVMNAGSVFEAGIAHATGLETASGERDAMTVVAKPLTEDERAGQVRQVIGEKYVQRAQMPWFIELSEVS